MEGFLVLLRLMRDLRVGRWSRVLVSRTTQAESLVMMLPGGQEV